MLTVREFNAAADRHLRRVIWALRILSIPLCVGLIFFTFFADPAVWIPAHLGPAFPLWAVLPGLTALWFSLVLVAALPLNTLARRDPRLVCPHCDKLLSRSRFKVVATLKCPRCRREVLDDSEPPDPPSISRQRLEELAARYRRHLRAFFLWLPLTLLAGAAIALGCEALVDAGWMRKPVSEGISRVVIVAIFTVMIWSVVVTVRGWNPLVVCLRCGWMHMPGRLLKTGQCANCQRTMVIPPQADGVAAGASSG